MDRFVQFLNRLGEVARVDVQAGRNPEFLGTACRALRLSGYSGRRWCVGRRLLLLPRWLWWIHLRDGRYLRVGLGLCCVQHACDVGALRGESQCAGKIGCG